MIALAQSADDDHEFIGIVSGLIAGSVGVHHPELVWIHKIDNWFDHKWLGFSGKTLGMIGVWAKDLTVPPFVSNRIIGKWHYRYEGFEADYKLSESEKNIHHRGWSAQNLQRRVGKIAPDAALYWFSGNTSATGRGSLMGYIPTEHDHWIWFLAFTRDGGWAVSHRKNIHAYEVHLFEETAAGIRAGDSSTPQPR